MAPAPRFGMIGGFLLALATRTPAARESDGAAAMLASPVPSSISTLGSGTVLCRSKLTLPGPVKVTTTNSVIEIPVPSVVKPAVAVPENAVGTKVG